MLDALSLVGQDRARLSKLARSSGVFHEELSVSGLCVAILDSEGRFNSINAEGLALVGLDASSVTSIQAAPFHKLWPQAERAKVRRALAEVVTGLPASFQAKGFDPAGVERWWDVRMLPLQEIEDCPPAVLVVMSDITRFRAPAAIASADAETALLKAQVAAQSYLIADLETKLAHAVKMNAMGEFVGAIVHDTNNLLSVMQSATRLMRRQVDTPDVRPIYEELDDSVARGHQLLRQLLDFSRADGDETGLFSVSEVIERDKLLLTRLLGAASVLNLNLDDKGWKVSCERSRISSVLFNLLANARDAMPNGGEARLSVKAVASENAPDSLARRDYICIKLSDTGLGMSPDVQKRLGKPYFTTKPRGAGTGIGVGSAFDLARRCDGGVFFDSTPGQGTTVSLYLARADG